MRLKSTVAKWAFKLLHLFSPEKAHKWGMTLFQRKLLPPFLLPNFSSFIPEVPLEMEVPTLGKLPHPMGLAAGFDKNGTYVSSLVKLGFSFLEIGTVTPLPQEGNALPRLFRLPARHDLINRMGFNNDGFQEVAERLKTLSKSSSLTLPLGVNIGKNKVTPQEKALDDYLAGIDMFADLASYLVINVSSPNTPGLRDLSSPVFIRSLSDLIGKKVEKCWVKLDPDMKRRDFQSMVRAVVEGKFAGLILTNTHRVEVPEKGGLSGHSLTPLANAALEQAWEVHKGALPMIGVGGIFSGSDVLQKIIRGAHAVQIYSGLVYRGPHIVLDLRRELEAELKLAGFDSLQQAWGSFYEC